jgi:hypothetical protein
MSTGQSVTAAFDSPSRGLDVVMEGSGSGTVTSSPPGISCPGTCLAYYPTNTQVTLTAKPAPGSTFTGWSGACAGIDGCTVTMSSNEVVGASFTPETPPSNRSVPSVAGSGSPRVGDQFTGSAGAWSGTQPLSYTYRWLRCPDLVYEHCSMALQLGPTTATTASYTLQQADIGDRMRLEVTATNTAGGATADGGFSGIVEPAPQPQPPAVTTAAIVATRFDASKAPKTLNTYRVLSSAGVDVTVGATVPDQTSVQMTALISDNGSSLISDNGSSLISDNSSSVTFRNLISDNGSSLISDNGSSLTVPVVSQGASLVSNIQGFFTGFGNWLQHPFGASDTTGSALAAHAAAAGKQRRVKFVLLAAGTHTFRHAGKGVVHTKLGKSDRKLLTRLMGQVKTLKEHHKHAARLTIFLTYIITRPNAFHITPQVVRRVVAVTLKP